MRLIMGPGILSSQHGTNTQAGTFTSSSPNAFAARSGIKAAWNYWPKAQASIPPSSSNCRCWQLGAFDNSLAKVHSVTSAASHPAPGRTQDIALRLDVCKKYQLWVLLCLLFDVSDLSLILLFPALCYPPRSLPLAMGRPILRESLFPWPSASKGSLEKLSKPLAPASSHFFLFVFFVLLRDSPCSGHLSLSPRSWTWAGSVQRHSLCPSVHRGWCAEPCQPSYPDEHQHFIINTELRAGK